MAGSAESWRGLAFRRLGSLPERFDATFLFLVTWRAGFSAATASATNRTSINFRIHRQESIFLFRNGCNQLDAVTSKLLMRMHSRWRLYIATSSIRSHRIPWPMWSTAFPSGSIRIGYRMLPDVTYECTRMPHNRWASRKGSAADFLPALIQWPPSHLGVARDGHTENRVNRSTGSIDY